MSTPQPAISQIKLQAFRSHSDFSLSLSPQVTLLAGANGVGKSSVVEAINLLATGQSFRATKVEEMVAFDQELARVVGIILSGDDRGESDKLEVILTKGVLQGKKVQKRYFELKGARRRARDIRGFFYTVVFRPEDLRLVEGSPSRRRSFLDEVISPLSIDYTHSLSTYEKTLIRRNRLLLAVREGEQSRTALQFWNLSLVKHGQLLQALRKEFLQFCLSVDFPVKLWVGYLPSLIDEARLREYQDREIAAGHTLIGPHKDDYTITADVQNLERGSKSDFHNIALFGSRGQQRLAVLWLKTCQLYYSQDKTRIRPMLLLDDILSELDTQAREFALSLMKTGQSLITTASVGIAERIERTFPGCQKNIIKLK